jgi:hypothetical protein
MAIPQSLPDLGTLIGARSASVHMGRMGLFAAAWFLSGLVWILIEPLTSGAGLLPLRVWATFLLGSALAIGSAVVAFRWARNDYAAAAVAALVYAAGMLPVSLLWTFPSGMPDLWRLITNVELYRLTNMFLTLAGLALALRLMTPLWLALGVGGTAAGVLQLLVISPMIQVVMGSSVSFSDVLRSLPFALAEPILFAAVFLAGFELGWVTGPDTAATATPEGVRPVGVLRMKRAVFVGIPAACLGIADLLVIAGNLMARSEPTTALTMVALAIPFLLVVAVTTMVFVYRMWAAIQDGHARTTPGRALGLMFVPLFNIYWAFQILPGFATDYNKLLVRHRLNLPPLPAGLFTAYIVLSLAAAIPVLGLAALAVNYGVGVAMLSKTCDAVNALPADLPG